MPCIEYKGKKYTYEEFGAMLKDGAFAKMVKSGELKTENLGAKVPSSLLEVTRREIAPETSSNFANLTTDENGNYVFFHRGAKGYEEVRPGTGQSGVTPSNEAAAIGRVGGVAMYYTNPTDSEKMVSGEAQYAVTVAPDEVYDFNEDPENYLEEARARFKAEYPNMAFDANNQLAYITKIAGENGYKMVVAEWNGKTRAQTTEAMKPTDVRLQEGDRVVKDFDKKYTTNKEKGFESVIPETKDSKLKALYNEIYKIRNDQKRYDGLYSLEEKYVKMSQDEITDLIMNSDLSDDIKQRYQEILSEKEGKRRSEKKSKIAENTKAEVDRIKSLDEKAEDGATFNLDGTTYEGVGLVVPVASVNTTMEELTPEMISDFVEQQKEKIGDDTVVKVGLYKFPNSNQVSIDLNIVAPESSRDVAIEFGRLAGQESLFDLSTYENIKTGATGANPINFNSKQFKEIAKALKEGKMPNVFEKAESFFEVSDLQEQVDNAKKAMAKLYPDLNFVIHDSYDDYNALAQDEEGLESAGFFDARTNTIHINKRAAEDNTVAHEVFHAVLFKMFGSDENINKNAKAMLKAIAKEIKSDQKLKEYLENFIANYDENVKSEEKLSELFAQIAAGYAQLNKKERSLIERFLNKIAELLGLRPFKTDEVLDLLNVLSAKITTGEVVTAEDVGAYGYGRAFVENPINEVKKSKKIGSKKTTLEIVYAEQDRIEELIKNGLLKQVEDISEFNDMYATTTSPDDMLVGSILINGKVKAEGNGGVFFVTKFGDVWASSNPVIAEQIAKRINKSIKINGGKGYLVLVKGSDAKLISSPQGASSSLKVVESLVMDGLISPSDFRKAVIAAIEENKDTKAKINFSGKLSSSDMISAVDSLFDDVSKSSFDNRGYLLKSIITELGKTESVKKNNSKIIEFLGGDVSKNIGWSPTSKTTNTSQSAIDLIANVSREELTKGLNNGDIYALIEVDDEVVVKEDKHKSYPFHIKQKNGKNPKLILLKNRQSGREVMVSESMEDNETLGKSFDGKVLGRASNGYGEGFIKSTPKFQRSTVAKKIEKALASGMSEAEVVADMVKAGYTEAEAKAYIDQYNAMRSDEYNRVKENIKGIIENIEKRAGKNADPKKVRERKYNDAMNYLQESLWYENADDTQREAAVRELRKNLGFSEKQAAPAEKVTKGAKETITINSIQALIQSIKDQNRGAKAALKDLKEKRDAFRKILLSFEVKGKITQSQSKTITNKALSLNLNNEKDVTEFLEYVQNTYKDAEMSNELSQLLRDEKMQRKGAREALKDLKEKRDALRKALLSFEVKGKISQRQSKTIANKALNLNLNNEEDVAEFLEYVENTYKDAEISNELSQILRDEKMQRKGAKSALKDLKEKREALRKALLSFEVKGKISQRQSKTITNKALSLNLNNEEDVAEFLEYVENTYKDAEMSNELAQLLRDEKMQRKGAREALRSLREKREALREALRSLVKAGKITNRQASVMINRAMSVNLNNDEAVNKLIKYIEKVYNNSEIADKMGKANAMRRTAKKNIRSKIGGAKVAFPLLDKLFSIDSREIPISVLDTYVNIVNQFGKRVGVLSTENMSKVIQDTQDVLDAVNQELSKAQDLAMIFEMYPDKVLDANGEVLFDKTVDKMKRDGYIDEDTAKEMDEYRSDIFKKERATKEEDEQERKDLIAEISSARLVTSSRIGDPNERKAAREIIEMARSRRLLKKLSTTSLRNLAAIMKNIDAGFFPNYGVKLMQAMQIEQQAPMVNETLKNVSLRAISTAYSAVYNSFKGLVTRDGFNKFQNKTIEKILESNMTMDFDFMLGDNKKRNIYNYIIKPLAKAYASFEADSTAIKEKMSEAVNMLESQFNGNPNKVAESKFKMMAYMLQKEFETNPNQKGVAPAVDFIDQTIKAIKARDTQYSEKDIEILEGIKANYMTNKQIDTNKIFDSLSPKEVKALRIVEEVNKSMYDKAIFTSGVIRGNRTQMYNNYVPHNVISRNTDHNSKITSVMNAYNNTQAVGTKAGSLQARVPGAKPIMFDPFLASMNSAIDVLLDFHMTVPMQTTSKLIQRVKSDINNNPESKNVSKDAINAIEQVRDNIAKFVFTSNKYYDDSVLTSIGKSFLGTMYRNTLASVPRFANELISNFSYVIANPANWVTGTKYIFKDSDYINGVSGRDIMSVVGSTVIGKIYGKSNTGKFSDVGFLGSDDVSHGSKSKSSFEATKDVIAKFSTKPVAKTTEYIGEVLMSTPDLLMSKPIWFGSFANEFKKQTGVEIDFSKLTDEKYRNKYKSAIEAATEHADNEVVQAGSTVNPFQKAAKMNVDPSSPTYKKLFARANNFLTNFMITEFSTARAAVYSLVSEGRMPKKKAAAVLIGVYMRVVMYTLLQNAISGIFYGALGYDDDDEETITWDDVVQAASSGLISLLINRNFGNIFKMAENYGVEKMNEEYGDFLRSGEDYDPYKHSLVFNKIQDKDIARKGPLRIAAVNLAGPYGKTVETAYKIEDIVKAESKEIKSMKDARSEVMSRPKIEKIKNEVLFNVATGSGLVPFAKDIRPIVSGKYKKKGED
jgi:predicted component of type VI protein secretion system